METKKSEEINQFSTLTLTIRQKAFLSVLLGALLGGATSTVSKIGIQEFPPLTFAFLRFLIASICILPFFLKTKRISRNELIRTIFFSLFASINIILFILGLTLTTATISQFLYAAVPLITGLIIYFAFHEMVSLKRFSGIIVGFVGISFVIFLSLFEKGVPFSGNTFGNLLIFTGVISHSIYMAYSKKLLNKATPFVITSIFIFITTIILLPFFLSDFIVHKEWWIRIHLTSYYSLFYIAIFSTIGTYLFNQYAIKHGGSIYASMFFYLVPILSFITAFFLLGEQLTQGLMIGGIITFLGTYLVISK